MRWPCSGCTKPLCVPTTSFSTRNRWGNFSGCFRGCNPARESNTSGGAIGNVLEWYDSPWLVCSAQSSARDSSRRQNSSTSAIGVFAAGYLMRMLVGFRFPDYEYGGRAESQMHFISESHSVGGTRFPGTCNPAAWRWSTCRASMPTWIEVRSYSIGRVRLDNG